MKFLNAKIENYRVCENLEIEFSSDLHKRLTVIRASNATCKSTILEALQWALYGDEALPSHNLVPLPKPGWTFSWTDDNWITITVTIEFTLNLRGMEHSYRLMRTLQEKRQRTGSNPERRKEAPLVFQLSAQGDKVVHRPDTFLSENLPSSLRGLFFTDGDRALTYIDSAADTPRKSTLREEELQVTKERRERVYRAIRTVMGFDAIDGAKKTLRSVSLEYNRQLGKESADIDEQSLRNQLVAEQEKLEGFIGEINKKNTEKTDLETQREFIKKQIEGLLQKGNRTDLEQELVGINKIIGTCNKEEDQLAKDHSNILKSKNLACDLTVPILQKAEGILKRLVDAGVIPKSTVPVLQHRLNNDICFCGESIKKDDPAGLRRRNEIEKLVKESEKAEQTTSLLTELWYSSQAGIFPEDIQSKSKWNDEYTDIGGQRLANDDKRKNAIEKRRILNNEINALPLGNIKQLQEQESVIEETIRETERFLGAREIFRSQTEKTINALKADLSKIQKRDDKAQKIRNRYDIAQDAESLLDRVNKRLENEELLHVSNYMNTVFCQMIGAGGEQANIQRAEISRDFDIKVYGPHSAEIAISALNGASKRALAFSFILALTKVSKFETPTVIDTPLGMSEGGVKRGIVKGLVEEGHQVILFLHRGEINECEDLIDEFGGKVFTITNSGHFPAYLVNKPNWGEVILKKCSCDHRKNCEICALKKTETTAKQIH